MELVKRSLIHCKRCFRPWLGVRTRLPQRLASSTSDASDSQKEGCAAKKTAEDGWERRVVTGLQPTGALHVGNYFGAVRRCVRAQEQGEDLTIFVADLHALTTPHDPAQLQQHTLQVTALLLAAGVEPGERVALFAQSDVAQHAQLCWLLACLATQARLAQLPQYREKAAAVRDVPLGLLLYPVLQAADVLLYRGTHVPVGADQLQHLQVAAQLVRTFHHRYGRAFPTPRALLADDGSDRLRSLRNPAKKMSKSDPDGKACVLLTDSDDEIRLKIRKAVTDFTPQVTFDPENRPGVSNLIALHCLAAAMTPEEVVEESAGLTTAQYKTVVAEALVAPRTPTATSRASWGCATRATCATCAWATSTTRSRRTTCRFGASSSSRADRPVDALPLAELAGPAPARRSADVKRVRSTI